MRAFLFRAILLALGVSLTGQVYPSSSPAAGGTFQRSAVEGCLNENLFNGIWRIKALAVEENVSFQEGTRVTGTGVTVQIRNGTTKDLAPDETGFSDINGHGIYLAYSDANTVEMSSIGSGIRDQDGGQEATTGRRVDNGALLPGSRVAERQTGQASH